MITRARIVSLALLTPLVFASSAMALAGGSTGGGGGGGGGYSGGGGGGYSGGGYSGSGGSLPWWGWLLVFLPVIIPILLAAFTSRGQATTKRAGSWARAKL